MAFSQTFAKVHSNFLFAFLFLVCFPLRSSVEVIIIFSKLAVDTHVVVQVVRIRIIIPRILLYLWRRVAASYLRTCLRHSTKIRLYLNLEIILICLNFFIRRRRALKRDFTTSLKLFDSHSLVSCFF